MLLKVQVSLPGDVQSGEQVSNQPHEHGHVVRHDLGDVEVSQSSHQHLVLRSAGVSSLQGAGHHQDRLDGSEAPVIVVLGKSRKDVSEQHTQASSFTAVRGVAQTALSTTIFLP